jgi:hypothetical protein
MTVFPHVRLNATGTLGAGAGNEIWSCGHKVVLTAPGAPNVCTAPVASDLAELCVAASIAWAFFIAATPGGGPFAGLFPTTVAMTEMKAAAVTASGHDDSTIDTHFEAVTLARGAASNSDIPYQVSLCATLLGDTFRRGSAAYGRMYLPSPNIYADPAGISVQRLVDGIVHAQTTNGFAIETARVLSAVNATVLSSGKIPRCANIGRSEDASGLRWQQITDVRFDSRPDTVRRRYSALQGVSKWVAPVTHV